MSFTTTLTTKNQLTLPKPVRDKLGLKKGAKIDIFPTINGGFVGRPRGQLNILEFAGDLADLDNGKPWKEIKEEAERLAVREWISQKRPYDKNHSN
ncbi:AbrB/MazE/SpoVT family DNA-binding domain-containing protein [Candidatus Daviesbacteria bacterium]|nr:AbrB/MazE/SpoVT family DNA-binding domain-containing protein [Candidatus Daviesbacteria bacterium]